MQPINGKNRMIQIQLVFPVRTACTMQMIWNTTTAVPPP